MMSRTKVFPWKLTLSKVCSKCFKLNRKEITVVRIKKVDLDMHAWVYMHVLDTCYMYIHVHVCTALIMQF